MTVKRLPDRSSIQDSIALKWMETASMYGTLTVVEGQPVITIYTDKNKNSGKGSAT